jgi:cell division protein ZipA
VRCDDLSVGEVDAADLDMEDAEAEFSDAGLSSDADELGEHGTPIKGERDFASAPDPIDVAVERNEMGDTVTPADPVAKVVDEPVIEETVSDQSLLPEVSASTSRRRTVKPASDPLTSSQPDSNAQGTVDWLDNLEPDEASERDSVEQGRLPRGANTHVFILYVVARSEEGFAGMDILQTLLSCDLRFGDMDFFHRHELASGRGPIEFSVANMMKPGVFDIDNMEPLQTRGLMFFVTLPGPTDMLKAFDYMYETAKVAAKALDGDIQDEKRSVVTRSSLEHMRQQIRELERRLLVRRT